MAKIRICPKCKQQNPAGILECSCGYDLMNVRITDSEAAQMPDKPDKKEPLQNPTALVRICSECGKQNAPQARKCAQCGEDISDVRPISRPDTSAEAPASSLRQAEKKAFLSSVTDDFAFDLLTKTGQIILGRSTGMSAYLKDKAYVSRRQAKLYFENGQIYLENVSETNPTFLNNEPLEAGQRALVKPGDEIGLGGAVIDGKRQKQAAYFVLREK